jgi:type 2 lantibiotic biosynthesis protein LanM
LAQATLTTLRRQLERSKSNLNLVGVFEGWGGVVYLLTHLATLWNKRELLEEAEALLTVLPELIARDEAVDVINGSAGCIAALLCLHQVKPSEQALAIALQCGDRLLTRSQEQPHGIGWPTHLASTAPLTGFAHGVAGIAWALLRLATSTGEERFRTIALRAIDYERSLFSVEMGNWPDLRIMQGHDGQEHRFVTAWCFGAAGIGLSRLASLPHLDDRKGLKAEIRIAAQTTLAHGFGVNHSLCHGDLGNVELLMQAGRELKEPNFEDQGRRIVASVLEDLAQRGPRCATPLCVESPGLMTGLAGIGYGLLRFAAPNEIPSVLLLEAPSDY